MSAARPPAKRAPRQRGKALTPRDLEIRALLVVSKGTMPRQEIADRVGCNRSEVFAAINRIQRRHPLPDDQFLEAQEILGSLRFWTELESTLIDELSVVEAQITAMGMANPAGIGFWNVRLGLLNQLQTCRVNRERFTQNIGLVQRAPEEFVVRTRGLPDIEGQDVYHEIGALDVRIEELERGLPPDEGTRAAGAETEALPLPLEGGPRVQGPGS